MGGHANQYLIFNQDGTGKAALSTGSVDIPLEVADFEYAYDLVYEAGEMLFQDNGESWDLRFALKDGILNGLF